MSLTHPVDYGRRTQLADILCAGGSTKVSSVPRTLTAGVWLCLSGGQAACLSKSL
jgi:hypothetical protein